MWMDSVMSKYYICNTVTWVNFWSNKNLTFIEQHKISSLLNIGLRIPNFCNFPESSIFKYHEYKEKKNKYIEPDLNQRPMDYYAHYSPPLYQLNYQEMVG